MQKFCKFLLKLMGWKTPDTAPVLEDKCIILGVPHTSAMDYLISWVYYRSIGGYPKIMVKSSFFWGPLGPVMKAMGAVPVDRSKGSSVALQIIHHLNSCDNFHLAIAPEGTRKAVKRWKSGFLTIAKACNLNVYAGYFDWRTKTIGHGEKLELSGDTAADLKYVQHYYHLKNYQGRYPECYTTGEE